MTVSSHIAPDGSLIRVASIAYETVGLVETLARLSALDPSVDRAFYCSPHVRHVAKIPREGGFCGYRNIQMMVSYLRDAKAPGWHHFAERRPSIFKIQDLIEQAWDMGLGTSSRVETGGIRMTRKYIGTPEALALFQSLKINCDAWAFSSNGDQIAYETMLLAVGDYFGGQQASNKPDEKIVMTSKPPLYFQHRGHSMTIVGLEARTDGSVNLIVFDPMFSPSSAIKQLIGSTSIGIRHPERLLKAHRRGEDYLSKYKDFEILEFIDRPSGVAKV